MRELFPDDVPSGRIAPHREIWRVSNSKRSTLNKQRFVQTWLSFGCWPRKLIKNWQFTRNLTARVAAKHVKANSSVWHAEIRFSWKSRFRLTRNLYRSPTDDKSTHILITFGFVTDFWRKNVIKSTNEHETLSVEWNFDNLWRFHRENQCDAEKALKMPSSVVSAQQ